ncbi:hypothetical protein MBEHAL_1102 [Halarchaeum acidiphilum MH1-52-1]|uniref:Uncharacterized protein n=1 Tax=Halarchaeum acidiphilum MH1-52-1 TaxID=1261545 RepID=U2YUE0_9EURY|nr:hypothetical protein [Halarchaeum acidiphilum]GAD52342.1 hypothetical protein MBEHAL_1102 [Halarchaeum acidiphilum MH1-52-1]
MTEGRADASGSAEVAGADGAAEAESGREIETGDGGGDASPREGMTRAIRAVRREGLKVAAIYATIDAVLVALLADLACTSVDAAPATVSLPALGPLAGYSLPVAPLVAVALGLVAFSAEVVLRARRPLVEQFEAVNPAVREALRTARDAATDGRETRMAGRLYERVLADLRETSSVALLDARRVAVTLVAVAVVALLCVHVAVAGITIGVGGGPGATTAGSGGGGGDASDEYGGLQNASGVLGDPTDVEAGDDALNASVQASSGGSGADSPESYDASGYTGGSSGAVESQQAGYDAPSDVEDADLIREYNLRIRANQTQS